MNTNRTEAIELNPCPCGFTPKELSICEGSTYRWRIVSADCENFYCPDWMIEVKVGSSWTQTEIYDHCVSEWNKATKPKSLALPKDDAVNISPEYVDENAKCKHDAEREAMGEWLIEQGIFPQADAERVALLERIDSYASDLYAKGATEMVVYSLLRDIRAYLKGGA
jgi:hypothetical protein